MTDALAAADRRASEVLPLLRSWVEINSFTANVDGVDQVGVHEVGPRATAHAVAATVVGGLDAIGPRPAVHRVRLAAAVEVVRAASAEQDVASREPADDVRAGCSDEPVVPRRTGDRARASGRCEAEDGEGDEDDGGNAHRLDGTHPVSHGLRGDDYDPTR